MIQIEIAYQSILTAVALYQAETEGLTQEDRDQLVVSMKILGVGAGLTEERMLELAENVKDEYERVTKAEEN